MHKPFATGAGNVDVSVTYDDVRDVLLMGVSIKSPTYNTTSKHMPEWFHVAMNQFLYALCRAVASSHYEKSGDDLPLTG